MAAKTSNVDESEFSRSLDRFAPGNWSQRKFYLPSLRPTGTSCSAQLVDHFRTAVEERNVERIKVLLHAGLSPDVVLTHQQRTALHYAAERGDMLMCQLLLSFDADPQIADLSPCVAGDAGSWTPMKLALRNQHIEIMHLFEGHLRAGRLHEGDSIDFGPNPGPLTYHKVLLTPLRPVEPGLMEPRNP